MHYNVLQLTDHIQLSTVTITVFIQTGTFAETLDKRSDPVPLLILCVIIFVRHEMPDNDKRITMKTLR